MIQLKEALIGRHNIDNASSNNELYIIFPFSGDGKILYEKSHNKLISNAKWQFYVLSEIDFYNIYGKDPNTVISNYSKDTIVWKTQEPKEKIYEYFTLISNAVKDELIDIVFHNPNYEKIK